MKSVSTPSFEIKYDRIVKRLITSARVIAGTKDIRTSFAQWDTGAFGTCISQRMIEKLDAVPVGYSYVHTPSGDATMPVYVVDIVLPNNVTFKCIKVMGSKIDQQGIDLLIGMDIISIGDFSITTERLQDKYRTCFMFSIPALSHIDI